MNTGTFFNNLFGVIGGYNLGRTSSRANFIPVDGKGDTVTIRGIDAIWLGLKNSQAQKKAYESCYALAAVVDKLAELDITGEVKIIRAQGKGKNDEATTPYATKMNALLEQPNIFQSWSQFRAQQVVYKNIFGFCPVFPVVPAGMQPEDAVTIINLPPWLFDVIPNQNSSVYNTKASDFVTKYTCTLLGKPIEFTADQIFILEGSFVPDENRSSLLPQSKLVGLDMAISNFCAAMEADNVLLRKKGPLGFISHDAAAVKDSAIGYLPMTTEEKDEIQTALTQYGMSWEQFQYVISKTAIKWNPMSYDVNQLGIKDTVVAAEKAICHRFGLPYVMYEEVDATYANGENALLSVYQNNVIPNNLKDVQKFNKFFKAKLNNAKIINDYSELPVLQDDALVAAQAAGAMDSAMQVEWTNDLITLNEWRKARGYDELGPEGDMRYTEYMAAQKAKLPQPDPNQQQDPNNPLKVNPNGKENATPDNIAA